MTELVRDVVGSSQFDFLVDYDLVRKVKLELIGLEPTTSTMPL